MTKQQAQDQNQKQAQLARETLLKIRTIVKDETLSTSDKIRALSQIQGLTKNTIAKILNVRYQFVYQVIKRMEQGPSQKKNSGKSHDEWMDLLNDL